MAVQKSRKTRSRIKMRRSHTKLKLPVISIDIKSKEKHIRHSVTYSGFYKGIKLLNKN